MAHLENASLRLDLARYIATFLLQYLTLVCWSWTSGFALGSLARRTVRVTGTLFCLVLFGELLAVPQHHNEVNAAVFQLPFYDRVLPLILRTVLVLLPSILGMRHGLRLARPPLLKTVLWAVVIVIMTAMASRTLAMSGVYGWWRLGADSWQVWLLPLAVLWPVGYMIATASWQRWSGKELGRA